MKQLLIVLFLTLRTVAQDMPLAVQIIETTDGVNGTRILHYKGATMMEGILTAKDIKDLPILIYSVTGKTRGGKSFLLDLMYKYLKSTPQVKGQPDWKEGQVPNVFDFKDGAESTTKGLWLGTDIFKRTAKDGTQVGIMLMDNQGLFDGEVTGGESVAMSGVSTILSYVQMFNMKEKITTNDLEQIILHLVPEKFQDENNNSTSTTGSSLMFVVRDFMGGKKHGFGVSNGTKYIEAEQNRGTDEYRAMWAEHRSVFNKIACVLLPHPGEKVLEEDFTNFPNLQDLKPRFVSEIDTFLKQLFAPENLLPHSLAFTGRSIHETLLQLDGKIADQSLSYFNMFIDRTNKATMQNAEANFTTMFDNSGNIFKAKGIMEVVLAESKFRGQTASKYYTKLKLKLEAVINSKVMSFIVNEYKNAIKGENVTSNHKTAWPGILSNMTLILGSEEKVRQLKQDTVKAVAEVFYEHLLSEEVANFQTFCENETSQEFYDTMLLLNQTIDFDEFLDSRIEKCNDFDQFGISITALNDIILQTQLIFGSNVKRIILRNMFKVESCIVDRYSSLLGSKNIKLQNSLLWPKIEKDIESLQFEGMSERVETIENIVEEIATKYYTSFKEEVHSELSDTWKALSYSDFYDMFHTVKKHGNRQKMIRRMFPEYHPFHERGLQSIWEDNEEELERRVELTIYQNLMNRGFSADADSFWDSVKVFFYKVGQKIESVLSPSARELYRKAMAKI